MAISRSSIGKSVSKGSKPKGGLTKWFKEDWVDIGSKKKGGGYAKCGRSKQKADAKRKYPKCVPAAKAASMSKSQIQICRQQKKSKETRGRWQAYKR